MTAPIVTNNWLLVFLLLPLLTQAQASLEVAEAAFPDANVVLVESNVHFDFIKPRNNQAPIIKESREEQYLHLKDGASIGYAITYDDNSSIEQFEAGAKVQDKAYESNDIFHSDLRIQYVQIGSKERGETSSVSARKVYQDPKYLTSVYFNGPQNCLARNIQFTIPEGYDVELVPVNFEGYEITKTESTKRKSRVIQYQVKNIKGYAKYNMMPGRSHIYPHLLIMTKGYKDEQQEQVYFNSLDALYAWYHQLVLGVKNEPEALKEMVGELTAEAATDEQKIKNIFYWVQDNIRYIAFEDGIAGYQPENCQTVFYNRYGDCKGMANLTKEMLRLAGFDARLVWLGTKSVATTYATPSLSADNHMICAVKLGEEFVFLDGTEKHTVLGHYAERIQNQEVLIEDGDGYIHTKIPVQDHLRNSSIYNLEVTLEAEETLKAKVVMQEQGEAMSRIVYLYTRTKNNEKEEAIKRYMRANEDHIVVEDFNMPEINRDATELLLEGTLMMRNRVSSFDDELYIYLDPYQIYESFALEEERTYDLWMSYKTNDQINATFHLPKGYKVSNLPESVSVKNDDFTIEASYEQVEGQLLYKVSVQVPNAEVKTEHLAVWNEAIKALGTFYEAPIVLVQSK